MINLYNEDCIKTMKDMGGKSVDLILTSPFYNTNKKAGKSRTLQNTSVKEGQYEYVCYDVHVDDMTNDEYCDYTVRLFDCFDDVVNKNGCVLYNICYGSENTVGMFLAVDAIIRRTVWTIADVIIWKKSTAMPNSCSSNKLTRIYEFVFVFCRKDEMKTFHCNKRVTSKRATGQKAYENIYNFIEAKNNDGTCPYNKATYSSELCEKLLKLYAPEDGVVYDPFMGSGTTAVACEKLGLHCIGSEISTNQVKWTIKRLLNEFDYMDPFDLSDHIYYELKGDDPHETTKL